MNLLFLSARARRVLREHFVAWLFVGGCGFGCVNEQAVFVLRSGGEWVVLGFLLGLHGVVLLDGDVDGGTVRCLYQQHHIFLRPTTRLALLLLVVLLEQLNHILLLLLFYSLSLQFFSNQLATPKNLRSSSLFPTNWTPNGRLFSPLSKGNEIDGRPI